MGYGIGKHDSLRLRLLLATVGGVVVISAAAIVLDYAREYRAGLQRTLISLDEQASALQAAQALIADPNRFVEYVHRFCATMDRRISPGHHILVLDPNGAVWAQSPRHSRGLLERASLHITADRAVIQLDGHRLACVRLSCAQGPTILVSQYLDYVEAALRTQLIRRLCSVVLVALAIIGLVYLTVSWWVIRPLDTLVRSAGRWAARDFAARARTSGPPDLLLVTREFNVMAEHLESHERQRLQEIEKACQIQANLLPRRKPEAPGLRIAAEFRPADHVGGDLYDVFALPGGRTGMIVLDVCGHGISAAMLTGVLKIALHWRLTECEDLAEAVRRVNGDLLACTPDECFATACVGVWDPGPARWTYCAAGHPGGVLFQEGKPQELASTGPLLGVLPQGRWSIGSMILSPHDRIFLYTDGIIEAQVQGELFGLNRLLSLLAETAHLSLHEQTRAIIQAVNPSADGLPSDDMTVLALELDPRPSDIPRTS